MIYARTAVENLTHARALELARLDGIVQKIWSLLDNPRCRFIAADTLIAISRHRCKILGITEGDKVLALTGRVDAEYECLLRQAEQELPPSTMPS